MSWCDRLLRRAGAARYLDLGRRTGGESTRPSSDVRAVRVARRCRAWARSRRHRARSPCAWRAFDKNMIPLMVVAPGPRSQRRTAEPRSGSARRRTGSCRRIRARDVGDSARITSRETEAARHPRAAAICGASRALRSRSCSIAWRSGTTDLISTTSTVAVGRCQARMSIAPRSPQIENETSTAVSQPQ